METDRLKVRHSPPKECNENHKNGVQKIKYSFLRILTGSDLSKRRLPLMEAKSSNPGPVVWLTACSHGDEIGGIVIIHEIFKIIRKNPLLSGTLFAFPLMNPIGLETASRNITLSMEDLNRSFPGNKQGSVAERMANLIFATIEETNPTLVLDLHNDWSKSIPYTLLDPPPDAKHTDTYEKAKSFSGKTGFLVISEQRDAGGTYDSIKTLTGSLIERDIPALTLEMGESFVVNEKNVEYGVKSIWNVLSLLGMTNPEDELFRYQLPENISGKILVYSQQPVSSTSGIIRFNVKPGEIVKKGKPVAKIYNAFGKLQETIDAVHDGILLGYSDSSVAFPGIPLMAFGIIDTNYNQTSS